MKALMAALAAALFAVQPAAAATVLGDFDVYASGDVYISGGAFGDIGAGSFTNANGATGANLSSQQAATKALTDQALALSTSYAGMTATGSFAEQWGTGTLTGAENGINVFNITVKDLSTLWKLRFVGLGDGAIVNVTGAGSLMTSVQFDLGAITDPSKVVINFVDLDSLWFNGLNLNGSLLAPTTAVRLQRNGLAGSVISESFHGEGVVLGGKPFGGFSAVAETLPTLPSAVPEPSTWVMMILGFGMIGCALRRRATAALGAA